MIVLTGGAGFIGSCFLKKLNEQGIRDILVVDNLDNSEKWKNLVGKKFIDYVQKNDFLDMIEEHRLGKPDFVVHLGACSSTTLTDSNYYIRNNYEYSKKVAQWAISYGSPFMYASSAATYGDGSNGYSDILENINSLSPLNMYGYSKHLFDLWVINNKLIDKVTGIKFFNVFGPNEWHKEDMMSLVCKAFPQVRDEGRIRLFKSYNSEYEHGGQKRDFIYIKDVVEVMDFFMKNPDKPGIYNLGTGEARDWNSLAKAMFMALEKTPEIEYIEMPDKLKGKYQYFTQADMDKLRKAGCDYDFRSLEDSVKDYVVNHLVSETYM